jgi:hypothetical protein
MEDEEADSSSEDETRVGACPSHWNVEIVVSFQSYVSDKVRLKGKKKKKKGEEEVCAYYCQRQNLWINFGILGGENLLFRGDQWLWFFARLHRYEYLTPPFKGLLLLWYWTPNDIMLPPY